MARNIRMLQNRTILGKDRRYGDTLTEEEFSSIPSTVRAALINTGVLEVFDDSESNQSNYQRIEARIDRLQNVVDQILMKFASLESTDPVILQNVPVSSSQVKEPEPEILEVNKSEIDPNTLSLKMIVSFVDEEGVTREGRINSIRPSKKTVIVKIGDEKWEVDFSDITIVEGQ